MANRNEELALDLDLFDNSKNGYVPEQRKKKKIEAPKLLPRKTVSPDEAKRQAAISRKNALIVSTVAMAFLLIVGSLVYSRVCLYDYQYKLNEARNQLEAVESENVRLQVKFNSMMSKDKVEDYALTKLGMVKKESYQISYFDMTEEDSVEAERTEQKSEN